MINQTFILEPLIVNDTNTFTACTYIQTNEIISCSGNTYINLGINDVIINKNVVADSFYGDASNLTNVNGTITGGTFNDGTIELNKNDDTSVIISGITLGCSELSGCTIISNITSNINELFNNDLILSGDIINNTNNIAILSGQIQSNSGLTIGETIINNGINGAILFQSGTTLMNGSNLYWDDLNKRLSIGMGSIPSATIDIQNPGSLSSDLILRTRNVLNTRNTFEITSTGDINIRSDSGTASINYNSTDGNANVYAQIGMQNQKPIFNIRNGGVKWISIGCSNDVREFAFGTGGSNCNIALGRGPQSGLVRPNDTANNCFYFYNGTAPTLNAADSFIQYAADISAGNSAPHFRTENGSVIKLYQQNGNIITSLANFGLILSGFVASSNIVYTANTISTNYTLTTNDYTLNCISGLTITLPQASSLSGKIFNIKNNSGGDVIIQPFISELIDDKTIYVLSARYESITIQPLNNGWIII